MILTISCSKTLVLYMYKDEKKMCTPSVPSNLKITTFWGKKTHATKTDYRKHMAIFSFYNVALRLWSCNTVNCFLRQIFMWRQQTHKLSYPRKKKTLLTILVDEKCWKDIVDSISQNTFPFPLVNVQHVLHRYLA